MYIVDLILRCHIITTAHIVITLDSQFTASTEVAVNTDQRIERHGISRLIQSRLTSLVPATRHLESRHHGSCPVALLHIVIMGGTEVACLIAQYTEQVVIEYSAVVTHVYQRHIFRILMGCQKSGIGYRLHEIVAAHLRMVRAEVTVVLIYLAQYRLVYGGQDRKRTRLN